MKSLLILFCAITALAFAQQPPTKASQTDETTVRTADEAWAMAITKKSIEETVSSYDPEAVTAGSAMPPAKGITAIGAMWTEFFSDPGFSLAWEIDKIVVTESKTIAYSNGTWRNPTNSGPYLAVWRKQPDGKWKVLIDAAWYSQKAEPLEFKNSRSPMEETIQKQDEALANAIDAKSINETVLLYDIEAVTAGSAMPSAQGTAALREMYQKMFAQPEFTLSLRADKIAIAESETIAYSSGIWTMPKATGPYLVVWRKQPGGGWKIIIDSAWYSLPESAEKP